MALPGLTAATPALVRGPSIAITAVPKAEAATVALGTLPLPPPWFACPPKPWPGTKSPPVHPELLLSCLAEPPPPSRGLGGVGMLGAEASAAKPPSF